MVVIVVVGFSENRFLHAIPNTKNTFPTNFPEHKQTIENIFLYVKYFQLKIFYTQKTFYILSNAALVESHKLIYDEICHECKRKKYIISLYFRNTQ